MNTRPAPPPEGALIAKAAARRGLSLRKAAEQAGISYGRWRQIATGYQNVSPGEFAIVRAPAGTLAKMARVVGVTAAQMAAAGREDVAGAMHDTEPEPAVQLTLVPVDDVAAERRRLADQWAAMVTAPVGPELREVRAAIDAAPPGASGRDIFPDTPALAEIWSMKETPPQYKVLDGNAVTFRQRVTRAAQWATRARSGGCTPSWSDWPRKSPSCVNASTTVTWSRRPATTPLIGP